MKTQIMSFAISLLLSISLAAQVKSNRPVGDFSGIKTGGNASVKISQGETNTVSLEGESQEELDGVKTEVVNGVLVISASGKGNTSDVKINITVKSLKSLEVSDAGDVRSKTPLKTEELTIKCSGAGDVHLEVEAKKITTELSGAGNVVLSGSVDVLEANVSGAGDLKASKLVATKAVITSSGAGDARVNVKQSLHATVSGAGDVVYMEEPAEKSIELSGAGSVRKAHSKSGPDKASSDTTRLSLGHKKVLICSGDDETSESGEDDSKHKFKHWSGLEFGTNGLRTPSKDGMTMPPGSEYMQLNPQKSYCFSLNLFEKDFHLHQNYINLVTGLGFEFNHYSLQNKESLRYDSTYTTAKSEPNMSYKKNLLNESLLTVPLLLEFNTSSNPEKDFHIAVGVIGGWKIGSKTRQDYVSPDGKDVSVVKSNDYNLDPFRYSLTARVGYRGISLFAIYGLSEFFKAGHGPEMYPASAGISVHI
jgi:hypothetical protein